MNGDIRVVNSEPLINKLRVISATPLQNCCKSQTTDIKAQMGHFGDAKVPPFLL
jgi:hypothetical protein